MTRPICPHEQFEANVTVNRILPDESGRREDGRIMFNADITIRCAQCSTPFRFIGLPHGVDLNGAAVSVDGAEARLAIAPKGEVLSAIEGVTGFTARRTQ